MKFIKWTAGLMSLLWVAYCWDVGAPWWAATLPPLLSAWLVTPDHRANDEFYLNNILQTLNRLEQAIHESPAVADAQQISERLDEINDHTARIANVVNLYAEVRLPDQVGINAIRESRFFSKLDDKADT